MIVATVSNYGKSEDKCLAFEFSLYQDSPMCRLPVLLCVRLVERSVDVGIVGLRQQFTTERRDSSGKGGRRRSRGDKVEAPLHSHYFSHRAQWSCMQGKRVTSAASMLPSSFFRRRRRFRDKT